MPSYPVTILQYQTHWCSDFDLIASELWAVLQGDALKVDHIGSTAVPGLCAKDVIDVQVTVGSLDDIVARKLLQAGFTTHTDMWRQDHLPPGFQANHQDWTKLFFMQQATPSGQDLPHQWRKSQYFFRAGHVFQGLQTKAPAQRGWS